MRLRPAATILLVMLALTGCAQHEAALTERPAGESLERVRMATIDVVLDKGYDILEAPLCRRDDGAVVCRGKTVEGAEIRATSPSENRDDVTVEVADKRLYEGSVRSVLEDAARAR